MTADGQASPGRGSVEPPHRDESSTPTHSFRLGARLGVRGGSGSVGRRRLHEASASTAVVSPEEGELGLFRPIRRNHTRRKPVPRRHSGGSRSAKKGSGSLEIVGSDTNVHVDASAGGTTGRCVDPPTTTGQVPQMLAFATASRELQTSEASIDVGSDSLVMLSPLRCLRSASGDTPDSIGAPSSWTVPTLIPPLRDARLWPDPYVEVKRQELEPGH